MQEQLLTEIEKLKGNQDVMSRPGTGSAQLAAVRAERDQLVLDNKALKA